MRTSGGSGGGLMARLPSGNYLMQQAGNAVVLFEDITEREIVRIPVLRDEHGDLAAHVFALAQRAIYDSELSDEDKCFAHFWSGYFYAHASR